jgi:transcriptional regulator GlxA family with amidase domain
MLVRDYDLVKPSSASEKTMVRVIRANPQIAYQFRSLVDQIMIAAATCSHFESTPAATCAAAELLKIASFVVARQQAIEPSRQGRPKVPRQEIIRRSMKLLEQRVGDPVQVDELATVADVSQRTLRTAFQEYFGLGPVRYLQLRQLHQVHRALKAADPEVVTVSRAFADHGAWAFGRFSARYRQLFGELPSETLRRTRPR